MLEQRSLRGGGGGQYRAALVADRRTGLSFGLLQLQVWGLLEGACSWQLA